MLAYQPVITLTKVNVAIGQGLAASKRIIPIIDLENKINPNIESQDLIFSDGNIVFNNVNFAYNSNLENVVLNDVSLKFQGGKMTALVGQSGSGKSTIANAVFRLRELADGSILVNNVDLKNCALNQILEFFRYQLQYLNIH